MAKVTIEIIVDLDVPGIVVRRADDDVHPLLDGILDNRDKHLLHIEIVALPVAGSEVRRLRVGLQAIVVGPVSVIGKAHEIRVGALLPVDESGQRLVIEFACAFRRLGISAAAPASAVEERMDRPHGPHEAHAIAL